MMLQFLNNYRVRLSVMVTLVAQITLPASHGEIRRVSPNGDDSDGATWETAFKTVCNALLASASGDAIWIASATYTETICLKTGVSLFGGFAGTEGDDDFALRDSGENPTIIDAVGTGSPVLTAELVNCATIEGLTLTGGHVTKGSGLTCRNSRLLLAHCAIVDNSAENVGGGVLCSDSSLTIDRCAISRNVSFGGGGGGIRCLDSTLRLSKCVLSDNRVESTGLARGGGLWLSNGHATCENTIITGNHVSGIGIFGDPGGGGLFCGDAGLVDLVNCTLAKNSTNFTSSHEGSGYAILCEAFDPLNSGPAIGILRNCIVSASKSPIASGDLDEIDVTYCDVIGLDIEGEGNINVDPQFVGGSPFDYHIRANSPCIDSGTKVDLSTDLDGNPRPVDVPHVGHSGDYAFDMGAYEWQLPRADLDGNGKVDSKDLMMFQGEWMTDAGATTE